MRTNLSFFFLALFLGCCSFFSNAQIGSLDTTFNRTEAGLAADANDMIHAMALQGDGKIVIGGAFSAYNDTTRRGIARLNTNGFLDLTFNPGGGVNDAIYALALQGNGQMIIGGSFTAYDGRVRHHLARLNADGSLDGAFAPVVDGEVYALAVQGDGKILLAGMFTSVNGTARNRVARLHADGTLDTGFNPGSGADNAIYALALQSDGKVVIGGGFTRYNGVGRNAIARLEANGALDAGFTTGNGASGGIVYALAIQQWDGKVLMGGYFTAYNGVARNYIARLNSNGSLDTGFNPGTGAGGGGVVSMAVQSDKKVLIGGYFTTYNGVARSGIARLKTDGSLDADFYPGSGAIGGGVLALAAQSDEKVVLAGGFTSYGGTAKQRIARINTGGPTLIIGDLTTDVRCAGLSVSIPVTVIGAFTTGNRFTLQLSDAFGRFTAPLNLATVTATTIKSIGGTIPVSIAPGNGYRVRVVSTMPAITSFENESDLTINQASPTPAITASGATTFCAGGSVVLTSSASDANQWYRNNVALSGETNPTLTVTGTGNYTVRSRENGCQSAASAITAVTVTPILSATVTYAGSPFCPVGTATPTIAGTKGGFFSSEDDINVDVVTGAVELSLPAGTYTIDYTMPASGGCAAVTTSTKFTIRQPVGISTQPESLAICTDNSARFTVAATGTSPTYQWRKNGVDISGATAATYTISKPALADAGSYSVVVKNACNSEVSSPATLAVTQATVITTQPVAQALCAGGKATFSVGAAGGQVKYQWRKAKVDIPGATGDTYTINAVTADDAGSYDVVVTGDCGSKTSVAVSLAVHTPISITTPPAAQVDACMGKSTSLTVTATGSPLAYQWYKGGSGIAGATARTYSIPSAAAADAGKYEVVVSNICGAVTSSAATVKVNPVPATPVITAAGNVLTSSAASGNTWFFNGKAISGAGEKTYSPLLSGQYTVQTTQNGCSATSEPYTFVYTAIEGPGAWNGEVRVYPNPMVKTLVISNPTGRKLQVQFFDGHGKKVLESSLRTTQGTIDVESLPGGVYQVVITDVTKNSSILQTLVKL